MRWRGLWLRGLYAHTTIAQAELVNQLNNFEGDESVGSTQEGWYVQGGFDVLSLWPGSKMNLIPFVRYEQYDTQAQVPVGYARNPENDVDELTLGAAFQPIPQLILKADWQQRQNAANTGVNVWNAVSRLRLLGPEESWPRRRRPLAAATLAAKVFLTQEEALTLAFPGAAVERRTAFLTEAQQKEAKKLSGDSEEPSALATYYEATKDGRVVGTAYFDTHVVRTMPETIMVVVDPSAAIARIEVISFDEPEDYLPRSTWYGQFAGKSLDAELT